ncbi:hypothetical protein [Nocardia sp. NPDC003963]
MNHDTLWHVDFADGDTEEIIAATLTDAAARARALDRRPGSGEIVAVRTISVAEALTRYFGTETDHGYDPVRRDAIAADHPWHHDSDEWLVLTFTTAIDPEGRIDPVALANFRTLHREWAGMASVRSDGGRISVHASRPAPADLTRYVECWLGDGAINPHDIRAVREELGLETRTTRVAARPHDRDNWDIFEIPVVALGYREVEAEAIAGLGEGPVIVVDAVPGFAAGCATYSELDHPDRPDARSDHSHCEHALPAALTTPAMASPRTDAPAPPPRRALRAALRALRRAPARRADPH